MRVTCTTSHILTYTLELCAAMLCTFLFHRVTHHSRLTTVIIELLPSLSLSLPFQMITSFKNHAWFWDTSFTEAAVQDFELL
jgi:hypothetical protein